MSILARPLSRTSRIVGPQTSVYKGYIRTWYGIVLHLMLWGGFFVALFRVPMKLLRKSATLNG